MLLVGVTLLNPRIMEYDIAPMTVPMALILWLFLARAFSPLRGAALACAILTPWNVASLNRWRPADCMLLLFVFAVGVWDLWPQRMRSWLPLGLRDEARRRQVAVR